jgi:formylglycine-generating enzyme required for sulfatase activity
MKSTLPSLCRRVVNLLWLIAAVAHAEVFTNHVGMKFVDIPAGTFYMGSCKLSTGQSNKHASPGGAAAGTACPSGTGSDAEAYDDETPQHLVSVRSFQLATTEVTLGQFKHFIQATDWPVDDNFRKYNDAMGDHVPVVQVSWRDAQSFIQWLNKSKPKTDQSVYRLPSEAEWEYAARAGTRTRYYFGDGIEHIGEYAWYDKNVGDRQRTVASKRSNAFGLYDMHGNVWEWTEDCWHDNYHGAPSDGSAWLDGDCKRRVVRGGSWFDVPNYLRAAVRFGDRADKRIDFDGFRIARALP